MLQNVTNNMNTINEPAHEILVLNISYLINYLHVYKQEQTY